MAPKRDAGSDAPGTLDSASAHNVEGLLNRANKRRNASRAPISDGILPAPPRRKNSAAAAVCGAPAVASIDQPSTVTEPKEESLHNDNNVHKDNEPIDLTQPEEEEPEFNRQLEGASGSEDDWEDIEEEGEEEEDELNQRTSPSTKTSLQGITINLSSRRGTNGGTEDEEASGSRNRRRQAFTKEDREIARLVHRSHLLCLLGRGLLYDAAADDPLLQATAFSLLPSSLVEIISNGVSSVDESAQHQALEESIKWFRGNFTLLKTSSTQPPAENEDEIGAAVAQAKGLEGISEQLLVVVEKRCGTAEELATIFAALLRSLGCLIRTVRLLEPSSLKPGDALRQQEQALKNYMKRKTPANNKNRNQLQLEKEERGNKVNSLAKAATDLLDGTASQRQQRYKEHIAAQLGLPDSSALKIVVGSGRGGAAPSIVLDPKKLKQGGTKGASGSGSASGAVGGGVLGKKRQVRTAIGPTDVKEREKVIPEPAVMKKKKKVSIKTKDKDAAAGAETKEEKMEEEKQKEEENEEKSKQDGDGFCSGGVPLESVSEKLNSGNTSRNKKRRGDEEFERELEVAMAATAFETRPASVAAAAAEEDTGLAATTAAEDTKKKMKRGGNANGGANGSTRGAAFGSHQGHVGRYWVEVYCGSTTSGRWVHVCPISGWIDRAEDVEGLAPRGHSIAYVVAFGGHGGAKDVTRRYASSFLSAEKQREGEWWEGVLRPLRSREVAALQGGGGGGGAGVGNGSGGVIAGSGGTINVPSTSNAATAALPGSTSKQPSSKQQQQMQNNKNKNKQNATSPLALAALREDKELEQRAAAERLTLPTTIDGFKSHATFILARHIGKYQALVPGSKLLGTHKGEAYYNREDVGDVHTAEKWKRIGRQVLIEELSTPAKKIKKRKMPQVQPQQRRGKYNYNFNFNSGTSHSASGGGAAGGASSTALNTNNEDDDEEEGGGKQDQEEMSDFYGIWQTKPWAPEAAVNGRVPKNERGNVEVPPFANALPAGTVHLQLPGLGPICKRLGIDYAPALTGFDIRGGRSVPSIEGIVVCVEHEAAVRAAFQEDTARRAQQAKEKRMAEAEKTWRELLRALLTRVRLNTAYASNGANGNGNAATGGGNQPQTAEGEAAAMLAHGAGQGKLKKGVGKSTRAPRDRDAAVSGNDHGVAEDLVDVKIEEI